MEIDKNTFYKNSKQIALDNLKSAAKDLAEAMHKMDEKFVFIVASRAMKNALYEKLVQLEDGNKTGAARFAGVSKNTLVQWAPQGDNDE